MKLIFNIALAAMIILPTVSRLVAQASQPAQKIKLVASMQTGGRYQLEQMVKSTTSGGKKKHTVTQDCTLFVTAHGGDRKDKLVSSKVDRVRIETNLNEKGEKFVYDSADRKKQHSSLAAMAQGLMGIRTAAIYGEDDVFKGFEGQVTDERIRATMQGLTDLGFPETAVGPGDTWKHQFEADKEPIGKMKYDLDYTFAKMLRFDNAMCVQLKIIGSVSTIPGAGANEGFDLKSRSLSGVMYFDPELGVVRKYEINSDVDFTSYGKKFPGSITMRTVLKKFIPGG
jgi:hypothetical protein